MPQDRKPKYLGMTRKNSDEIRLSPHGNWLIGWWPEPSAAAHDQFRGVQISCVYGGCCPLHKRFFSASICFVKPQNRRRKTVLYAWERERASQNLVAKSGAEKIPEFSTDCGDFATNLRGLKPASQRFTHEGDAP